MGKRGLTLLEILIAVFIFSLVMLGLVNVFVGSRRFVLSSRAQITAAELSRYFLGNLSQQVRQDQWNPPSNCLSGGSCPSESLTLSNMTYSLTYNVTTNVWGTNLSRVKVNITWNELEP